MIEILKFWNLAFDTITLVIYHTVIVAFFFMHVSGSLVTSLEILGKIRGADLLLIDFKRQSKPHPVEIFRESII